MIFSCCASWLTIQVCTLNLSFPGTVTIWLTNILYALHVLTNFTLELFSIESESTMNSHLSTNQTMCLTRTFQPTNHDCKQTYLAPSVSLLIDKYWREIKLFFNTLSTHSTCWISYEPITSGNLRPAPSGHLYWLLLLLLLIG